MDKNVITQEFSKLTFDQQKEKLIAMVSKIKDSDPMFSDLFALLQKGENLDAIFLTGIYQDIMQFAEAIQTYNKIQKEKALSSIENKLEEMKKREAEERIIELQEVEQLIANI